MLKLGEDCEVLWITADGRLLRFSEISDAHLRNIIRHAKLYSYHPSMIAFLEVIARLRGLNEVYDGSPEPWLDTRDGKYKTYAGGDGYVEVTVN